MLERDFFLRNTHTVAQELLGKYLYRQIDGQLFRGIISETEAYHGPEDLACHCAKGKTPRTEVMFEKGGKIYVYLIYGMYDMLNFTTMEEGFPAAVLIRGVMQPEILQDGKFVPLPVKTDGPGKLTKHFRITRELNKNLIHPKTGLWVEESRIKPVEIIRTPRIGVDYAGPWKEKPWRYLIKKL